MHNNSGTTKYLSFNGTKAYDRPPKVGFESLASPGQVITVSTAEGFDSNRKPYASSIFQTNIGCKQAGTGYTMTTYNSKQFETHSFDHDDDKRTSPISNITNQNISVTMGTPFAHRSTLSHQSREGGVTALTPVPVTLANKAFVGTTDLRSAPKPTGGPAQLTIFYAGSVCVFDDVSPEKAQAIMLLAGNENTPKNPPAKTAATQALTTSTAISTQVETPTQRASSGANSIFTDKMFSNNQTTALRLSAIPRPNPISESVPRSTSCFLGKEPRKTTPFSSTNFPSPMSVSPHSSGPADFLASRSFASIASPTCHSEPSKQVYSQSACVSSATTTTTPSAVPQARKASLARFMAKRKERTESISPYPSPVKQLLECATPGSEKSRSFPIASSSSFSLSFTKKK